MCFAVHFGGNTPPHARGEAPEAPRACFAAKCLSSCRGPSCIVVERLVQWQSSPSKPPEDRVVRSSLHRGLLISRALPPWRTSPLGILRRRSDRHRHARAFTRNALERIERDAVRVQSILHQPPVHFVQMFLMNTGQRPPGVTLCISSGISAPWGA